MLSNIDEMMVLQKKLNDSEVKNAELTKKITEVKQMYNESEIKVSRLQVDMMNLKKRISEPANVRAMFQRIDTLVKNLNKEESLRREYEKENKVLKSENDSLRAAMKEMRDVIKAEVEFELKEIYESRKDEMMKEIEEYKKSSTEKIEDLQTKFEKEKERRIKAEEELNENWDKF